MSEAQLSGDWCSAFSRSNQTGTRNDSVPAAVRKIKHDSKFLTISLVGLRAAVGSAAGHSFSSEPSEQCARPSHTSSLGTHAVLSLHRKSSEAQEEKPREGGAN